MKKRMTLLCIPGFLLFAVPAYALKQYHCDGKVQFYPCDVDARDAGIPGARRIESVSLERIQGVREQKESDVAPRVFDETFERVSGSEGMWRGHVSGKGLVGLRLFIMRKGLPPLRNEIGAVQLDGESTFFAFKSQLPKGDDWTWEIKAFSAQ